MATRDASITRRSRSTGRCAPVADQHLIWAKILRAMPWYSNGRESALKLRTVWVRIPPRAQIEAQPDPLLGSAVVVAEQVNVGGRCESDGVYDERIRAAAREAMATGESLNSISKRLGVSRSALRDWRDRAGQAEGVGGCPRCSVGKLPRGPFAELLGLYLGDGCLSALKKGVYSLRIACDDRIRA
jgi:hypothetical protein